MDLDNFIIGKTKEMRGEGRFGKKKSNSCLTNIERKRYKKSNCFPNIEDRKGGKNRGEGRFGKKKSRCCFPKKATAAILTLLDHT